MSRRTSRARAAPVANRIAASVLLTGVLAVALTSSPPAHAQRAFEQNISLGDGTEARLWLDARAHDVTDLIKLSIEVETPAGRSASVITTGRRLGDLRIMGIEAVDPVAIGDGKARWRWTYTLEPLHGGEVVLRPLTIASMDTDEHPDSVERANSRALTLEVNSALPDGMSLLNPRDIALPEGVEPQLALAPVSLLAALALGLILGIMRFVRARWRRSSTAREPQADALQTALARLEAVRQDLDNGRSVDPWTSIVRALRDYLEARFEVPAERRTSEELVTLTQGFPAPAGQLGPAPAGQLEKVLGSCDGGRFGRAATEAERVTSTLASAISVLHSLAAMPIDGARGDDGQPTHQARP